MYGMFFIHPVFLICSFCLSMAYYVTIKRTSAFRLILCMIPLFAAISLINPLFNTRGQMVIFEYMNRPYTMEALLYGMAIAAMLVSVILWFASYNEVMTSDKFLYIFGRAAPALSLVLTMVLRFVPNYVKKLRLISCARSCIGKGNDTETNREKARNGITEVSSLVSWALEGGVITVDSMRSRGYGSGRRSNFSVYRFEGRDRALLCAMITLAAIIMYCAFHGAAFAVYTPHFEMNGFNNIYVIIGSISYFIFLAIPTVLNIMEAVTWRVLRSRI